MIVADRQRVKAWVMIGPEIVDEQGRNVVLWK